MARQSRIEVIALSTRSSNRVGRTHMGAAGDETATMVMRLASMLAHLLLPPSDIAVSTVTLVKDALDACSHTCLKHL